MLIESLLRKLKTFNLHCFVGSCNARVAELWENKSEIKSAAFTGDMWTSIHKAALYYQCGQLPSDSVTNEIFSNQGNNPFDALMLEYKTMDAFYDRHCGQFVVKIHHTCQQRVPEAIQHRVEQGETVHWSERGFVFESFPCSVRDWSWTDGIASLTQRPHRIRVETKLISSSRPINEYEDGVWYYKMSRIGESPDFLIAVNRAIDAPEFEVTLVD